MASYKQADLVELDFPISLPDGNDLYHPVLIISCHAANSRESHYTGIMMTASTYKDMFSFNVSNDMFDAHLNKSNCQLRLQIIVTFKESQIKKLLNKMKKIHFKAAVEQLKDYVLSVD
ncbi:type II toxin-antitoxin system PemK/MazF family toxin [Ferruginibacter sp. SUN002]|uniref:type II toxin-antitoxin system PemK/MazF family toxin n=1 Tax=Ferruginibacter sp. SUN002 TaxID=2937789 RepID=UPI003D35D77A